MPGDVVPTHVRQIEIHKQDRGRELDGESESSRTGFGDAYYFMMYNTNKVEMIGCTGGSVIPLDMGATS